MDENVGLYLRSKAFFGWLLKNISPAKIIIVPTHCRMVSDSPSSKPHMIATIGIISVTVEANKGVEILRSL